MVTTSEAATGRTGTEPRAASTQKRTRFRSQSARMPWATRLPVSRTMLLENGAKRLGIAFAQASHRRCRLGNPGVERAFGVPHVGDAARHAGTEVATDRPEDHCRAAGHVLASVIADPLDHGQPTGVPNTEPLAGRPGHEELSAGRPVQHGVATGVGGWRIDYPAEARSRCDRHPSPCRRSRWQVRRGGARSPPPARHRSSGRQSPPDAR